MSSIQPDRPLRIGTRASQLALWQADRAQALIAGSGQATEIVKITSEGDANLTDPLHKLGGYGIFTRALDEALLRGEIELAVHSCKDIPTVLHPDLELVAIPEREDPRDVLLTLHAGTNWLELPARLASGSPRRQAQWLHRYPHHSFTELRGNMATRLGKLTQDPKLDGIILAAAGLKRLGWQAQISEYLDWMIPAPAQGAIAWVCRRGSPLAQWFRQFDQPQINACVSAERWLLNQLEAGCSAPIGVNIAAEGVSPDGSIKYALQAGVYSLAGDPPLVYQSTFPAEMLDVSVQHALVHLLEDGAREYVNAAHAAK